MLSSRCGKPVVWEDSLTLVFKRQDFDGSSYHIFFNLVWISKENTSCAFSLEKLWQKAAHLNPYPCSRVIKSHLWHFWSTVSTSYLINCWRSYRGTLQIWQQVTCLHPIGLLWHAYDKLSPGYSITNDNMSRLDCLKINRQGNAFFNNTHRQWKTSPVTKQRAERRRELLKEAIWKWPSDMRVLCYWLCPSQPFYTLNFILIFLFLRLEVWRSYQDNAL